MTFWKYTFRPDALATRTDEQLCREVLAGSHQAFLALFDRYSQQVLHLANSVIRDQAEAEDLAQNVFLEVHQSMLGFDSGRGAFRTLLFRYTYTRAIDHRRRLQSRHFYSNVDLNEVPEASFADDSMFSSGLWLEERAHYARQAMRQLDERQLATVEAYFFRNLSLNEIAEEQGDSFGNVRHHLYRGLAKMRQTMAKSRGSLSNEISTQQATVCSNGSRKNGANGNRAHATRLPAEQGSTATAVSASLPEQMSKRLVAGV